jgi:hypothetical protein
MHYQDYDALQGKCQQHALEKLSPKVWSHRLLLAVSVSIDDRAGYQHSDGAAYDRRYKLQPVVPKPIFRPAHFPSFHFFEVCVDFV